MPANFFAHTIDKHAARPCLILPTGTILSYTDLLHRADALASQLGTTRQLIFLEASNSVPSILSYVACLRAGHAILLLDPHNTPLTDTLTALYNPNILIQCTDTTPVINTRHHDPISLHPDLALLLTTSGSTGSPKLVKLSYDNIQSNTEAIITYLGMNHSDRTITSLNFHYSYGMSVLNTHLAAGASIVLTDHSIQEQHFWHAFQQYDATNFSGVPYSFELIQQLNLDFSQFSRLRFVTQAGGRLPPPLVQKYVRAAAEQGWRFYVMYGQTEAAPRMAYLPHDLADDNPDSIGVAIPNGHLEVIDGNGHTLQDHEREGELVYTGPNVMIGYAQSQADLSTKQVIPRLFTGDLALKQKNGLFRITGRKSRFVKAFGYRLNLDDIEAFLATLGTTAAAVATDDQLSIFVERGDPKATLHSALALKYHLPPSFFRLQMIPSLPRLPTGKTDYHALSELQQRSAPQSYPAALSPLWSFAKSVATEFVDILIGHPHDWHSVEGIFRAHFPAKLLNHNDTFLSLGGDSLLHVGMALSLEEYLGHLPADWYAKPISELEALHV